MPRRRGVPRSCWWLAVMVCIFSSIHPERASGDAASARNSSDQSAGQVVPAETLLDWRVLGVGSVETGPDADTIKLSEGADSKGVVLLSAAPLPDDFILRFEVKPLQADGIPVVLVSTTPLDRGGRIDPGPDYDGAVGYWTGDQAPVQSYAIGFHTSYHQPYAFIRKNPGYLKMAESLDIAKEQRWYEVEIGRRGERIWLTIDGLPLLSAYDSEGGLPQGYLGFRLRGPGDGSFAALYRNVTIEPRAEPPSE